jgi:hypothetical protein
MCGGGKKTTTNSTQTSNVTSTPTNPEWVTNGVQGLAQGVSALQGHDPTSFFAGATPLNQQSFGLAGLLGQGGADNLQQAGNLAGQAANSGPNLAQYGGYNPAQAQAGQVAPIALGGYNPAEASHASAASANPFMSQYFNPYTNEVVNNSLNDLERSRQMAGVDTAAAATAAHAFGGSRHGVADALTNEGYARQAADISGQLRSQGFDTALNAAQQDANRQQQVGLFNAGQDTQSSQFNSGLGAQMSQFNAGSANARGLAQAGFDQQANLSNRDANNQAWQFNAGAFNQGNQFNANQQDNAATRQLQGAGVLGQLGQYGTDYLSSAGQTQQGLAQQQAGAPLSVMQALTSMYGSLPFNLFQGQNVNGLTNTTGTVKQPAGGLFGTGIHVGWSAKDGLSAGV